jgi:hypothetical protein
MIYVLIPTCLLLIAKLAIMNIDLKASRKAYAELRDKYNSLVDEYF